MEKHLLIIDDEEAIRFLLSEALVSAGYRVTAVSSPMEAVDVVRNDPPALVITDLQLVDSDGFEVIEQVKALNATMPIIMLTGVLMDPDEIPEAISKQIAAYVPKTASFSTILEEVKRCAG